MSLDKKMIEHGFLIHDFYETFKEEDGSRPDEDKIIEQYSQYWPWEAEDVVVYLMRLKRIEYLLTEEEKQEIFKNICGPYYSTDITTIKMIVDSIEERIGLIY